MFYVSYIMCIKKIITAFQNNDFPCEIMIFKMVLHDERGLSILKCSILWWITPMLTFIYNKNPSVYQSGASKSDCTCSVCAPPLFKEMLAFVQMSFVWTTKFYLPSSTYACNKTQLGIILSRDILC